MQFEQIWLQYQANLKTFLHSRVSDPDDVDDLLQNIMIKVYEKHHSIRSEASVKSWLFKVTNNTIIDYYRRKKHSQDLNASDLWGTEIGFRAITDLEQCVDPFISALPAESAKLLRDIDINGQSQKEYAISLGVSYSTLKSRVHKARSQLRKLFEDCCHFSLDAKGNIIDYESKHGDCDKC